MTIETEILMDGTIPVYDFGNHDKAFVISENGKIITVDFKTSKRIIAPLSKMNEDFIKSMNKMLTLGSKGIFITRIQSDGNQVAFIVFE